jgi:hypothetical protein
VSGYSANVLQMQQCTVDSRRKSKQRECGYKDGGMISRCLGAGSRDRAEMLNWELLASGIGSSMEAR